MPTIELFGVTKKFGDFTAVKDASLSVKDKEYVTLLGPSGCGKTTLLRTIAGLISLTEGDVLIDGRSVIDMPPEDRNIGYLFQNYALFPHMNVGENVGYGPMVKGENKAKTRRITEDMLRLVKLLEWARILPDALSGGMQQRIALVRSLAAGCKILLLDEPLSSLDPKIGIELRYEIQRTAKKIGLTVIHVTHDQQDAMSISDKVVVMKAGRLVQVGAPRQIYNAPATPYVAYFIGDSNFIRARSDTGNIVVFGDFKLSLEERFTGSEEVVLSVRPENILFDKRLENSFEGVVEQKNFMGSTTSFTVSVGSVKWLVSTAKHPEVREGDKVFVYIPPSAVNVFRGVKDLDEELRVM